MATEARGETRRKPVYPFGWECYHNGSTLLTREDAVVDFLLPYNAGADGLVIWGDAGGDCNSPGLSCMCDPAHNGPTKPTYFENVKHQTGPLVQEFKQRVDKCSNDHCSGNGRCTSVTLPESAGRVKESAPKLSCYCFEGFSGPTCESDQL